MGTRVLAATPNNKNVRSYAHCAADSSGDVVLVLENLSDDQTLHLSLDLAGSGSVSGRTEYHATGPKGMLSLDIAINDTPLALNKDGTVPEIEGKKMGGSDPLVLTPASWAFVQLHGTKAQGC